MSKSVKKTTFPQGTIKSVKFDRLFPTDRYLNSRIGLEYELAPGQKAEDALNYLNEIAEEWWRLKFPHMVGKPVEQLEDTDENALTLTERIQSATTLEELRNYRAKASSNYYLHIVYKAKHQELTQKVHSAKMKPDATILKQYLKAVEDKDEEAMARITAIYDIKTEENGTE